MFDRIDICATIFTLNVSSPPVLSTINSANTNLQAITVLIERLQMLDMFVHGNFIRSAAVEIVVADHRPPTIDSRSKIIR